MCCMIFCKMMDRVKPAVLMTVGALALTACATTETDDTTNSQLVQPAGAVPEAPIEAGDVAIAAQYAAHAIRDLPQLADITKPALVQFTGVTSIINGPVDTQPYTDLLRDRLLVGSHSKLRFIERELPPLIITPTKKIKSRKELPKPIEINSDPDYQVLAELRGNFKDDFYKIQIQFIDSHSGAVLFNGLYRIRKEMQSEQFDPAAGTTTVTTESIQIPQTSQGSQKPPDQSPSSVTGSPEVQ